MADYDIYGNLTAEGLRKRLLLQEALPPSGQVTIGGRTYSDFLQRNMAAEAVPPLLGQPAPAGTPASVATQAPVSLLEQRKAAIGKELKTNLAISGIAQAAQLGAALIPTTSEIENRRRLKEIDKERAALAAESQNVGLSARERELMLQSSMAPVQALARESRQREEAAAASMGGASSAAGLVRARREARDAVQGAALQAAMGVEQADIQTAQAELAEIARKDEALQREMFEREQAKGQRQRALLNQAGQLAGGVAGLAGQVRGAQALKALDTSQLPQTWSPAQQEMYMRALASGDTRTLQTLELMRMAAEEKEETQAPV